MGTPLMSLVELCTAKGGWKLLCVSPVILFCRAYIIVGMLQLL